MALKIYKNHQQENEGLFMNLSNKIVSFIGVVALLGLSGCAHYRGRPLRKLAVNACPQAKEQFIALNHQIFNESDCCRYLDRNVIAKGYQPVQITFVNNTERCFNISKKSLSFTCVPTEEVARSVYTSTVKRAVGYGVAGLFLWPLLIPAVVDSIGSAEANEKLYLDFMRKTLRSQTMQPFTMTNKLVFAYLVDFDEKFSFTAVDTQTRESFVLTPDKPRINFNDNDLK